MPGAHVGSDSAIEDTAADEAGGARGAGAGRRPRGRPVRARRRRGRGRAHRGDRAIRRAVDDAQVVDAAGSARASRLRRHASPHLADRDARHLRGLDAARLLPRHPAPDLERIRPRGRVRRQLRGRARGARQRGHHAARLLPLPELPRPRRRGGAGADGCGRAGDPRLRDVPGPAGAAGLPDARGPARRRAPRARAPLLVGRRAARHGHRPHRAGPRAVRRHARRGGAGAGAGRDGHGAHRLGHERRAGAGGRAAARRGAARPPPGARALQRLHRPRAGPAGRRGRVGVADAGDRAADGDGLSDLRPRPGARPDAQPRAATSSRTTAGTCSPRCGSGSRRSGPARISRRWTRSRCRRS